MEYLIIIFFFLLAAGVLVRRTIKAFKGENCHPCSHDCGSCELGRQNIPKDIVLKEKGAKN